MAQKDEEKTTVARGGYQPLNQGYSPRGGHAFIHNGEPRTLPKAPPVRSGEFTRRDGKA